MKEILAVVANDDNMLQICHSTKTQKQDVASISKGVT